MRCSNEDNWIDRCRVLLKYSHWVHYTVCDLLYVIYDRWEVIDENACSENVSVETCFMILSRFHFMYEWWSGIVANMLSRLLSHSCCYFNGFWAMQINEISLVIRKLFDFMQIRNLHICFYITINAWRVLWSNILILLWIYNWFWCFHGRLLIGTLMRNIFWLYVHRNYFLILYYFLRVLYIIIL